MGSPRGVDALSEAGPSVDAVTQTTAAAPGARPRWEDQRSLDELGTPLRETTFCVVDLETTGASVRDGAMITEVGAVKVRGGEVLGEFATLVDPGAPIPAFISVLTGISNTMVCGAPRIEEVLPSFLEFAAGCVLVAHNAPFDIGFLRHFAAAQGREWPDFAVVDTVRVARRVVTRDETPDCKLSSLARVFGSATVPDHRALSDARATVDVLHALIGRLGGLGVHTVEELATFNTRVSPQVRRKRHLADGLPHAPGVYLFRDQQERVLYVGTSRDLRTRVRTYFTASEKRSRMGEMVGLAERVEGLECATALEAEVRELRLIGHHKPPYNRRSKFPERTTFLKLTREHWPRLSVVTSVLGDDADYLGPFSSRKAAQQCLAALHETFPVRQCGGPMPRRARRTPCALAELGRCLSPCDGSADPTTYAAVVRALRETLLRRPDEVVATINARMHALSLDERFEEAGTQRDRLASFVRAAARSERLASLASCAELVAARRGDDGRWEAHVVRHGRLAAAGTIPGGTDARVWVESLRAGADTVAAAPGPVPAASAAESEKVLRWLELPGVRLVDVEGQWTCPVAGATRHLVSGPLATPKVSP